MIFGLVAETVNWLVLKLHSSLSFGNPIPSDGDVKQILRSVGVDEEQLNVVIQQLAGKDVNEVMASGASVPSGDAAAEGVAAAYAQAEEAKVKEKKEESESDEDMGFDLFG